MRLNIQNGPDVRLLYTLARSGYPRKSRDQAATPLIRNEYSWDRIPVACIGAPPPISSGKDHHSFHSWAMAYSMVETIHASPNIKGLSTEAIRRVDNCGSWRRPRAWHEHQRAIGK